jgi:hypothetical protein
MYESLAEMHEAAKKDWWAEREGKPMRETVEAVISKVTPQSYGWDVAFGPDNDTWVSIHKTQGLPEPEVGDTVVCTVPRVIKLTKWGAGIA